MPKPYSFTTADGMTCSGVDRTLHSLDDQPAVTYPDGTRFWYKMGKLHRDNGPAVVFFNGIKEWFRDGVRHRDGDNPAVIYPNTAEILADRRGGREYWNNGRVVKVEK